MNKRHELRAKIDRLERANHKEYVTRGNTQRCQDLFAELEKTRAEFKALLKSRKE